MSTERATIADPDVMNGTPCFRGRRVPFKNLMDYLEDGHSLGEFLEQFPTVTRDMAVQALEEANSRRIIRRNIRCVNAAPHSGTACARRRPASP
jgi:uncharacterized protein (DUF433 family)